MQKLEIERNINQSCSLMYRSPKQKKYINPLTVKMGTDPFVSTRWRCETKGYDLERFFEGLSKKNILEIF
jgi:hypothetical protein